MVDAGVDLARLAAGYDHRIEAAAQTHAGLAADACGLGPDHVAVDVGGGRGAHAAVFARRCRAAVVVDRSPDMARHARDAGVLAVVGDGARLPIVAGAAHLVYSHLAIHHGRPEDWLAEARRVVAPGGTVWVWTLAREHLRASMLARWFPSVVPIDEARFPEPATLAAAMAGLGLAGIGAIERVEPVRRTAGSWLAAVRAGFVSTLQLIDPAELEAGLAAFTAAHPDPDAAVDYTLHYAAVWGVRPVES